ncbi:MAG: Crp/Fnr family transcriptional regulator [Burkholderiales bacterium]|nr:Crp/Fnr family transcriptional regulator [Burkholderiales bacterium]
MVSIEILRQIPCFHDLELGALNAIAQVGAMRTLSKDAYLFRTGDKAEALYILVSGQLLVSRDDAKGKRLHLASITPGICLGEMGLSQGAPRSADVSAKIDSVLVCFYRSAFEELVREQPVFALTLLADLSKKLHEANHRLENRVSLSVKERLWEALNKLAHAGCISPPPKVTHLAAQIDATREMTSKALNQLVREKKVEKESLACWRIFRS